ncbi:hypothetical protein CVT26_010506 [Gymnopilus dilepis]|uniref:F-box domain-containing protein n=1 Tax=Gymnopilus dilepis TaxID=231916 RepID=A0A409Y0E4_9AGAR|nr:hypothetical protein CVT26_010506 [Gymnopilus dilepis]
MSSPSPALPLDILTTIIEDLSPSIPAELHTLRSLALSSKLLTPLCQRVIFKRVDLRNRYRIRRQYKPGMTGPGELVKPFARLVSSPSSKHIGSYVLHLSYKAYGSDMSDGAPSTILSSLTALRSLHFSWFPEDRPFDFNTLSTGPKKLFRDAIEAQLRSEHLLQVTTLNIRNFPFGVFVDRASLIDLVEEAPLTVQLSIVSLKPALSIQPCIQLRHYALGSISWPRRILDVDIGGGKMCLQPPSVGIPPLDVSSTKRALICVKEQINSVEAEKVIRCAKGGIEELSYQVTEASSFRGLAQALLSSSSSSSSSSTLVYSSSSPYLLLTTLELSHTSDSERDPLSYIADELALLSSGSSSSFTSSITASADTPHLSATLPHLHTLSLSLMLLLAHAPLPAKSLRKLDELLSDRRRFPSLKTLSIEITVIKRRRWSANGESEDEDEGASSPSSEREGSLQALLIGVFDERKVQAVLDHLKARHLASLPRLMGMQSEGVVEVQYNSIW